MTRAVLTVGHSTRSLEELVVVLRAHGVEELVDVRRYPGSRRMPWFSRPSLEAALAGAGIRYRHDERLGGRRRPEPGSPNAGWRNEQFRGYADHMASEEFAAALDRLVADAAERTVAVMCAEAVHWRCHRSLLADALDVRGVAVEHVQDARKRERHRRTPFARVEDGELTYPPKQEPLPLE